MPHEIANRDLFVARLFKSSTKRDGLQPLDPSNPGKKARHKAVRDPTGGITGHAGGRV
jgi:hypothetical protein